MSAKSQQLGKYELYERLARGGMGEVWKALDTQLQRTVAIKLLRTDLQHDLDFVVRFKREAQLIAALHHPNIVQIHDFHISYPPEAEFTQAYMVMDYVEGQTLADYIRKTSRKGDFPVADDLIYIFSAISLAIDYAHGKGMIHRDIKPANILLDQRLSTIKAMGEPILTDFGIARLQGMNTGTVAGTLLGTPHYISPEQALGKAGDKRSDLYSLGIILYEITTGVTPFRGDTTVAIIMQHVHNMPTPPSLINSTISPELSALILKSIAKNADDRFQSASEMTIALAGALHVPIPKNLRIAGESQRLTSISDRTNNTIPELHTPFLSYNSPYTPTIDVEQVSQRPVNANTPMEGIVGLPLPPHQPTPYRTPVQPESVAPVMIAAPQKSQWSSKRRWIVLLSLFLAILLLSSALSFVIFSRNSGNTQPTATVVGQVHFSDSTSTAGNYNQIQIDLRNIPDPPADKIYYAWLDSAANETDKPHWPLSISQGAVHTAILTYPGYPNLLLANGVLLITTENANTAPIIPQLNAADRHYYALLTPPSSAAFDIKSCTPGVHACLT